MKFKTQVADCIVGFVLLMLCIVPAQATCPGAAVQSSNYCLLQPGFGTVGGSVQTSNTVLLTSNMYPFQAQTGTAELAYWRDKATRGLNAGKTYRDSLLLIGVNPLDGSDPRSKMLNDPTLNYGTAGLLTNFPANEAALLQARDTFAYQLYRNYPDAATARANLLDAIKTLANLYLMIADEYLIDVLDLRFPPCTLTLCSDKILQSQIDLLGNAQGYYEKAVNAFVYGFSTAVGTNITIADAFDDAVYSLFNLAVERLSMTLREKSSKQLALNMVSDPAGQQASATLKAANVSSYLATAAIAQKQGSAFDDAGAGSSLINALNLLRNQGNIYTQGLNPLGYDNRYVPANDFSALISRADSYVTSASSDEANLINEKRLFDSNYEALQSQLSSLRTQYMNSLASYTGCGIPANPDDIAQRQTFEICTGEAGNDLFDCSFTLSTSQFDACIKATKTIGLGSLASKYRAMRDTEIHLTAARLKKDDYLKRIDYENQKANGLIEIKRNVTGATNAKLDEYLPKLMAARKIVETSQQTTTRKWDSNKNKWSTATKEHTNTTSESFSIRDDNLLLNTNKEKDMNNITMEFDIQNISLESADAVKNLLLNEAEAEIEIDAAVQQQNSALADFNNLLQDKENLWQLFELAIKQLDYYTQQSPEFRILRSQAAIELSKQLNGAANFAYLAAKALEYQYVQDLTNLQLPTGSFRIADIFKAQTSGDIRNFVHTLKDIDGLKCAWGNFGIDNKQYISLARHILGLSGLSDKDRRIKVQEFINQNKNGEGNLQFNFTLTDSESFLNYPVLYNIKIWDGAGPTGCSGPTIGQGVAVSLETTQTKGGYWYPRVTLRQTGHSSLKGSDAAFHQYIPIYNFEDLLNSSTYVPTIVDDFQAYIHEDPRSSNYFPNGSWSGRFHGRSISSANWDVVIYDPIGNDKTNLSKITDIVFYFDTLHQSK